MKKIKSNAFKYICATCKHFKAIKTDREFEKILDTEYTLFTCRLFKWKKKEYYLMAPVQKSIDEQKVQICEFWEQWSPDDNNNGNED